MWVCMEMTRFEQHSLKEQTWYRFSLAQAISEMLSMLRLEEIDPTLLGLEQAGAMMECAITNRLTDETFVELGFSAPGQQALPQAPAILLRTDYSSGTLRKLTGLPFPYNASLEQKDVIILAHYSSDFTRLVPTETYEQLREAAAKLLKLEREDRPALHELVYKGAIQQTGPTRDEVISYVHQHYYDNSWEPALHLILSDPLLFNPVRIHPDSALRHRFAYLRDSEAQIIGELHTIMIDDTPGGMPTAGIWLTSKGDNIHAFEQATGLNLSTAPGYEEDGLSLLLAAFTYNRGYSIEREPDMDAFLMQSQALQSTALHYPSSPFTVHYTFHMQEGYSYMLPNFIEHHYHMRTLELAVEQLLATELPLLSGVVTVVSPFHLETAKVLGLQGEELATLGLQSGPDGSQVLVLTLSDKVMTVAPNLWEGVLGHCQDACQTATGILHVPIGGARQVTGEVFTNVNFDNLAPVVAALGLASRIRPIVPLTESSTHVSYPITIELCWSQMHAGEQKMTATLQMPDIFTAHDYLLRMDDKLFVADPNDTDHPFILRGILHDPSGATLAQRFYTPANELDNTAKAGFYIQYDPALPAAITLQADARKRGLIGSARKDELNTFSQIGRPHTRQEQRARETPSDCNLQNQVRTSKR